MQDEGDFRFQKPRRIATLFQEAGKWKEELSCSIRLDSRWCADTILPWPVSPLHRDLESHKRAELV